MQHEGDPRVRITTTSERVPVSSSLADMFERDQDLRSLVVQRLVPALGLPTGRLVATDYLDATSGRPFADEVAPGNYTVYVVQTPVSDDDEFAPRGGESSHFRTAFARVEFHKAPAVRWEPARLLDLPSWQGFGVDHGMAALFDDGARDGLERLSIAPWWPQLLWDATSDCGHDWAHVVFEGGNAVICSTGWGDGYYRCYLGLCADGDLCCLVADFGMVDWKGSE